MEENIPILKTWLNFGLITTALLIVLDLVLYVLDAPRESTVVRFVPYLIFIGGSIWAAKSYRDIHSGGLISYGKSFSVGFMTSLLAAIIVAIYTFIFIKYIDPSIIDEVIATTENNLLDNPDLSDEQIDNFMEMSVRFMNPTMMAISTFIWNVVVMAILNLIISIFIKKELYFVYIPYFCKIFRIEIITASDKV